MARHLANEFGQHLARAKRCTHCAQGISNDDFQPWRPGRDSKTATRPLGGPAHAHYGLAWAAKAGLVANPGRLATALEQRPGPFGDGLLEFAEALGIEKLAD